MKAGSSPLTQLKAVLECHIRITSMVPVKGGDEKRTSIEEGLKEAGERGWRLSVHQGAQYLRVRTLGSANPMTILTTPLQRWWWPELHGLPHLAYKRPKYHNFSRRVKVWNHDYYKIKDFGIPRKIRDIKISDLALSPAGHHLSEPGDSIPTPLLPPLRPKQRQNLKKRGVPKWRGEPKPAKPTTLSSSLRPAALYRLVVFVITVNRRRELLAVVTRFHFLFLGTCCSLVLLCLCSTPLHCHFWLR